MSNFQIYKKTLCFSVRKIFFDLGVLVFLALMCAGGFLIAEKAADAGLLGLGIGLLIGAVIAGIIAHFFAYMFKAGQIAMMTKAIAEGSMPDNVYAEGKKAVKERFLTVAAYYVVTRAIKGIFSQIGRGITAAGRAIGGDTGQGVGSAISSAIQILVGYLCDCCLGWVFYRSDKSSVRATLEGAVLFFKHGKTLLKNVGRIFGMGLVSFLGIAGSVGGITYFVFSFFRSAFDTLSTEIMSAGVQLELNLPQWMGNTTYLMLAIAGVIGVLIWSFVHSAFIRPFILAGVLRNYILSGMENVPTDASFRELDGKSAKFAQLHAKLGNT